MFALDATEEQLDFTTIYGSAKNGWMSDDWRDPTTNIVPLLDAVIENIPEAPYRTGTSQMQVTALDFSSFTGRIAIGRIFRGDLQENKDYTLCKSNGTTKKFASKNCTFSKGWARQK